MKCSILIINFPPSVSLLQHLPHQISNQWYYDISIMPSGIDYVAIAINTVVINNTTSFKLERRNAYTGEFLETTYDRFE